MHSKSLIFYLTLIVLLKQSCQYGSDLYDSRSDDYDENNVENSYMEVPTTPQPPARKYQISAEPTIYETTKISADKGSDVVLECSSEDGKAMWLVTPTYDLSITPTSEKISTLSVRNVTHDHTYECRRSYTVVQRFVVTVNGPHATIVSHSHFVRNGTNIQLSCLIRSILPDLTTAYLRVNGINTAQQYLAHWESKRRLCANNDYNRTDCLEETTFQFSVDVTDNGVYTCGYENVESIGHVVEVIDSEPIIYEATKICSLKQMQRRVVQFTVDALEKHGLNQNAASDIRDQCDSIFRRRRGWNCIIGRENFEYSLASVDDGNEYASFRFSLGSVFVAVFRTK